MNNQAVIHNKNPKQLPYSHTQKASENFSNRNDIGNLRSEAVQMVKDIQAFNADKRFDEPGKDVKFSAKALADLQKSVSSKDPVVIQKAMAKAQAELIAQVVRIYGLPEEILTKKHMVGKLQVSLVKPDGTVETNGEILANLGKDQWKYNPKNIKLLEAVEQDLGKRGFITNDYGTCPDQIYNVWKQLVIKLKAVPTPQTPKQEPLPSVPELPSARTPGKPIPLNAFPPETQEFMKVALKEYLKDNKIVGYGKVNDIWNILLGLGFTTKFGEDIRKKVTDCLESAGLGTGKGGNGKPNLSGSPY